MEYASIEREIHIEAPPEAVFEVVSSPEHVAAWWADGASFRAEPGAVGELVWGDRAHVEAMTVVKSDPPHVFSFRWVYADGVADPIADSLLVTFELVPTGTGTTLRMTETGFREMGWEEAKLAAVHADHASGWDVFVPRLGEYAEKLASAR